jgi:hypothetical protein
VDPQPQPAPPVDFTAASRAQHASAPFGAGPPQQVTGVSERVWDVLVASVMSVS